MDLYPLLGNKLFSQKKKKSNKLVNTIRIFIPEPQRVDEEIINKRKKETKKQVDVNSYGTINHMGWMSKSLFPCSLLNPYQKRDRSEQ